MHLLDIYVFLSTSAAVINFQNVKQYSTIVGTDWASVKSLGTIKAIESVN